MKQAYIIAGVVIVVFALAIVILNQTNKPSVPIQKFTSMDELRSVIEQQTAQGNNYGRTETAAALDSSSKGGAASASGEAPQTPAPENPSYGTTNVQVAGVDEPDILKNDGHYLYAVSNGYVSIIEAYPTSAASIVSKIHVNGTITNILINGDKLIILGQESYGYAPCPECGVAYADAVDPAAPEPAAKVGSFMPTRFSQKSFISVYDISSRSEPNEEQHITFEGWTYDARLIGSRVYIVAQQPIFLQDNTVIMPAIEYGGVKQSLVAQDVAYFGVPDSSYELTTIFTFDTGDLNVNRATFLTGATQTMYVSENNIYLASQKYLPYESYQKEMVSRVYLDLVDSDTRAKLETILAHDPLTQRDVQSLQDTFAAYYNGLSQDDRTRVANSLATRQQDFDAWVAKETQKTVVDKLSLNGADIAYAGKAEIPGTIINQFSMDEYKDTFRIATTTGDTWSNTAFNHIYVLDSSMNVIGKLEDLAQNERIYSVRFMGDRAYMVTFKQLDPLFVIDLSDGTNPRVLGELKIPGYSTYLHPYDATHIIGIGQDTSGDVQEGSIMAAIPAGIKIALFDISDVEHPTEVSHVAIGGRGSSSPALYDHKAFLFDSNTGTLAIPVTEYATTSNVDYGSKQVFDGLYVYHLDAQEGFTLKGKITHLNASELVEMQNNGYSLTGYEAQIMRSTFIGDVLYTLSSRTLQANSLSSFDKEFSINLPKENYTIYPYRYGVTSGGAGFAAEGIATQATPPVAG